MHGDPLKRYRADFQNIAELPYKSHPSYARDELIAVGQRLVNVSARVSRSSCCARLRPSIFTSSTWMSPYALICTRGSLKPTNGRRTTVTWPCILRRCGLRSSSPGGLARWRSPGVIRGSIPRSIHSPCTSVTFPHRISISEASGTVSCSSVSGLLLDETSRGPRQIAQQDEAEAASLGVFDPVIGSNPTSLLPGAISLAGTVLRSFQ